MAGRITENMEFRGQVRCLHLLMQPGAVNNNEVGTATPITADKLQHAHRAVYSNESATTAVSEARVVHVVHGLVAEVQAFKCGCVVACTGAATVVFDLLKNGTTILSATVTVNNGHAAYEIVAGTIDTAGLVQDDVLEVDVTATAAGGTIGLGAFAFTDVWEDDD